MATWQTLRDFARGIVRIGSMEPEDIKRGELWFDESDPRHVAKDPHSYDAHEYGKHPEFVEMSADRTDVKEANIGTARFGENDDWIERRPVLDTIEETTISNNWTSTIDVNVLDNGYNFMMLMGTFDTNADYRVEMQFDSTGGGNYTYWEIDGGGSTTVSRDVDTWEFGRAHSRTVPFRIPLLFSGSHTTFRNFSAQQIFNRDSVFWGTCGIRRPDTIRFRATTTNDDHDTVWDLAAVPFNANTPWRI